MIALDPSAVRLGATAADKTDAIRQVGRILIDAGVHSTFKRLGPMLEAVRTDGAPSHQALILTHVDSDHIAGMLPLLASPEHAAQFAEIWFNGRKHLEPATALDVNGDITDEKASGYTGRIVCYTSTGKLGNMTQAALLAGAGSATCNAN